MRRLLQATGELEVCGEPQHEAGVAPRPAEPGMSTVVTVATSLDVQMPDATPSTLGQDGNIYSGGPKERLTALAKSDAVSWDLWMQAGGLESQYHEFILQLPTLEGQLAMMQGFLQAQIRDP